MGSKISAATAERSEMEALADIQAATPEPARTALGMSSLRLGGGVALSVRNDPTGFWSRVLAFGFDEPITAGLVGQAVAFLREQRTPSATFQFAPATLPRDWEQVCVKEGLTRGDFWAKLVAEAEPLVARLDGRVKLAAHLRVAPIEAAQARLWASTMLDIFGMPRERLSDMVAACVGRPGWHPFGVWDGDKLVATAALYAGRGGAGQFFGGSTLPEARGQGAQTALLAARARAAAEAGCRWLVSETGAEKPGTHNSSLHNMLRLGFEVLYERPNWGWRLSRVRD